MNPCDMLTGRFHLIGDEGITVEQRVIRAAECYRDKTGDIPNRAHVNPLICNVETSILFAGNMIDVIPDPTMLQYVTWIGIGVDHG